MEQSPSLKTAALSAVQEFSIFFNGTQRLIVCFFFSQLPATPPYPKPV
jgi:hypothetical protein